MKLIKIIQIIVTLLPQLIDIIKAVESAVPTTGSGAEKLALVRGIIENVFNAATDITEEFADIWPVLVGIINNIVSVFNAIGIFKKA